MNFEPIFYSIEKDLQKVTNTGQLATYIPELSKVDSSKIGVHLSTQDNRYYKLGDSKEKFSIF